MTESLNLVSLDLLVCFCEGLSMEHYRYFILNQKVVVAWGILQVACASLCVVCGFIDAVFRMSTTLSETRAPLWAGTVSESVWSLQANESITLHHILPYESLTACASFRFCLDFVPVILYLYS